ncbi:MULTISPECIES: 30S ribosomal protein S3 [unclassified Lacihabitans]|jgi:small subunit ribosomal protein S3|uniref:30S ribosomal protein S3 n=1 Tax=unclassified Lacihabitans TaxID=2638817 RepID=UPI000BD93679|nr:MULTISPECIES: 30S ribosomal protein S3 [unclassified Lacihabitans]MBP6619135.1 30S ribosomal protein S3 [Leadbetterella sp.]OYU64633.1 MAG: 30S ribosomal protein S3 [Cytophagaceae bacterium BCCC1]MCP9746310.1 30S ribosomal protein S3 [Lacihabitans sp. CS3-21]MCP9755853.1 30S ribosomal protein S3 [Lacihabitans sp. CCS-44]MDP1818196.1 30S ribosomal protein S3 [Leadbetterella sp.]
MGQKVNPVGFRLGYIRGWESNWYGGKNFAEKLVEDDKIRKYINARIPKGSVSRVVIERTLKRITLTIHTARPGVVIGKAGSEVDKLREELKKLTKKDVQINIFEIKRPEIDAKLVGETIAQQLRARISFRRAMKQAIQSAMRVGAQGIKIKLSGRLGGAEMARSEMYKEGRIPLHTLRADIDYAISESLTVYGLIGIKVWVFKGEVFGKRDLTSVAALATESADSKKSTMGGAGGGHQGKGRRDEDGDKNGRRKKTNNSGGGGRSNGQKRN